MDGIGVELGDHVLTHQADHLQGVLLAGHPRAEHQLIGAGRLPAPALRVGVVRVADDEPARWPSRSAPAWGQG